MSEYQYYEFLALDRPLTEKQRAELRSISTARRLRPRDSSTSTTGVTSGAIRGR